MIFFPVVNLSTDQSSSEGEISSPSEDAEDLVSPTWRSSLSLPSSQDVARAVAAAATAASSPRPSVVFSSQDEGCSSPLKRFQNKVSRALKGFSQTSDRRSRLTYNPEVLTSQKRQWASFQLQSLDHRSPEEPSKLFENMVVVGLHPSCDVPTLRKLVMAKKSEVSGRLRFALSSRNHSRLEPSFEPQVLFAFPPEKQLPLKYRDLLSFCFPGGIEVHAVEKNSSMSELNEILLGQDHLRQSELSFVFRLQVPDNSPLYGCCVLMEELVDKPSRLISMMSDKQTVNSGLERYIFTTKRCYCILSRLPFFELHFGVLNRMFMEERLERLTRCISILDLELPETISKVEGLEENDTASSPKHVSEDVKNENSGTSQSSFSEATASVGLADIGSHVIHSDHEGSSSSCKNDTDSIASASNETNALVTDKEPTAAQQNSEANNVNMDSSAMSKPTIENCLPDVGPSLQNQQSGSSEPSSSFQGSPCEARHLRSDNDEADTEEASTSGQDFFISHSDMLEWAKENNHGSLQVICEYYKLSCPPRGSTITFHPIEHLDPLEFHRPGGKLPHISGSSLDLGSYSTSLERAEVLNALVAEEEATTLSAWGISCICGSLRLEHVLTLFAGALLEKQIVFVCSNLGILSASVLSLIPLIRPYQWQSLLMPILPNDMLDFLDAPVPFIVGIQNKTSEVQSKLTNAILVDLSKNQVRSPTMPQLPKYKELLTALAPYHSKLVGEGYIGRKRLIAECTDEQVEAAKGFMEVLRNYLDSLCSNLRSHTITNVQSNDDKVSLLLKESFIDSFPSHDRPFMKCFVDTQLFSVHTDLVLSFYQKD